jgi:hypothetical protein
MESLHITISVFRTRARESKGPGQPDYDVGGREDLFAIVFPHFA